MTIHDAGLLNSQIDDLNGRLRGGVFPPSEAGYLDAAPWNTSVPFHPALVVFVEDAPDVAATFQFAARHGYRVAVQATGHGAVARPENTVLINTGGLDDCVIDTEKGTATVGAGVTAQRLIDAAADHGLAAIVGSAGTVGVAGYLSGGGVGPLVSTFGLSSDYIDSMDVVTADGEIRHVSPIHNPDLFWAFRGGKARLGVITRVTLRLEPLTHFYGGVLWFDGRDASSVVHEWASWSSALPNDITTSIALTRMPLQGPPKLAGRYVVSVRVGSVLSAEDTETHLATIRDAGTLLLDDLETREYRQIGRISDEPTDPEPLVQDEALLSALPCESIDALLVAFDATSGAELAVVEIRHLGGALARKPSYESAFSYRDAPYSVLTIGFAPAGETDAVTAAGTYILASVADLSEGRILGNFVATPDPERASRAFDEASHQRLLRLVDTYDPKHVLAL